MNFDKLTQYLDSLEASYGIPMFDCRITKDHRVIYRHMAGWADYGRKIPVTRDHLYRMYSLTKVITATAVMQAAESGKINLYDRLDKYLPEYTFMKVADNFPVGMSDQPKDWPTAKTGCHLAHNSIRLIDLLTMSAGMSYDMESEVLMKLKRESGSLAGTREVVKAMAQMPLLYEPGTRWEYSLAHDVLAAVLEVVSDMPFGDCLKKNIFDPLEISDFYMHPGEEQQKKICDLYRWDKKARMTCPADVKKHTAHIITENYESGGGGLIGTTEACGAVMDALCCGGVGANGRRILKEETIRLMSTNYTTVQMRADFDTYQKRGYGYGLGVRVLTDGESSRSPLGEFGWDGAAGGYVLADPFSHISIVYMQHVVDFWQAYDTVHPTIRDLAYEALQEV